MYNNGDNTLPFIYIVYRGYKLKPLSIIAVENGFFTSFNDDYFLHIESRSCQLLTLMDMGG